MTVGIIGLGRFGALTAKLMSRYFSVVAYDVKPSAKLKGVKIAKLEEAASQEVVILAVPIRDMIKVLRRISPFVRHGALVCDVCSVKEKPIEWMKKYLPAYVSILGTHPLFGPDSYAKNFKGNDMVLCPVRIDDKLYRRIKREVVKAGLNVFELTPAEHDKLMANTQWLTHAIARSILTFRQYEKLPLTKNYQKLMEIVNSLKKDSRELFEDITRYNRFARGVSKDYGKLFNHVIELEGKKKPL